MPRLQQTIVNPRGVKSGKPVFVAQDPARLSIKTFGETAEDSIEIVFPYGPREIQYQTLAAENVTVKRPQNKPLLVTANKKLRTVTFDALIADRPSGGTLALSVSDTLSKLEEIASNGTVCKMTYGLTALGYSVKITKLSFNTKRINGEGEPIQVEVNIQLTESPVYNPEIVELQAVYYTPTISPVVVPDSDEIIENESSYEYEYNTGDTSKLNLITSTNSAGQTVTFDIATGGFV